MIISKLTLHNFGIFYGQQSLDFGPGLYIVRGDNGRGKTTLLNAVRWALYGHYEDRQGREVPPEVILNRDAYREGERQFSVELVLSDGEDRCLVRRSQDIVDSTSTHSNLYMEKNGQALTSGERQRYVNQLLSEEISPFFLFDGEQLQRYERLLTEKDGSLIKHSIEQILGLPVLDNALEDLRNVRDELGKRLAKQARQTLQLEQLGGRAEQAQADLEIKDAELADLEAQTDSQVAIVAEQDKILQRYESSIDQLKSLETVEERIRDYELQRTMLRHQLGDNLRDAWKDILSVAVAPKVAELRSRIEKESQALAAQALREQVEKTLGSGTCIICGTELDAEHREHVTEQLALLAPDLPSGNDTEQQNAFVNLSVLAGIANTGSARRAIDLDTKMGQLEADEVTQRQHANKLREDIQNLPEAEVRWAQTERDAAQREIGRISAAVDVAKQERAVIEQKLTNAREEIRRAPANEQQKYLSRAIDIAEDLMGVFDQAKVTFRDELRESVESEATRVFRQLTNEPNYDQLDINDNYGLEIIANDGSIVIGRSAGEEQVVALSLIAGLNRNARRKGPVMMDTPFARLDEEHRAHVLGYLSRMADQVFLLVHGAEVRDEDLRPVASTIEEQLFLQRDDTDRTSIVVKNG